jgi:hypothetical protein
MDGVHVIDPDADPFVLSVHDKLPIPVPQPDGLSE